MTRILVVRHGETVWNLEGRVQGHGDSPLSKRGEAQALALARRLTGIEGAPPDSRVNENEFDAVYCSDLGRAGATIEPFVTATGADVRYVSDLREKSFGEWEGLSAVELEAQYPDLWYRYHTMRDIHTVPPGGETWSEVAARTVGFLRCVIEQHLGGRVLIVGHGGALRPLMLHALQAPLSSLTRVSVDNAGISTLHYKGPDDGRIVSLNDCSHLEGIA